MFTRKAGWLSLLLAMLFLAVTTIATLPLVAQDRGDRSDWARECSLRTLHGRYGIFVQGTLLATSTTPAYPFVVSGLFTYDGEGNVSGTYTQSVGGLIVRGTADGTYQVNPDCTYSAELGPSGGPFAHRVGTITGEGMMREIHILYTDPSSVAFGTLKKTPERCSLETLKGDYALYGQGTIPVQFPGFPPPPVLVATSGSLTFDGKGNFSGSDTHNLQGSAGPVTFYGTYEVTSDCEVSAVINSSNGSTLYEEGSITGEGEFKELHDIFTNPGWVFTDTLKKQ